MEEDSCESAENPKCRVCGVPYEEHLGVGGTCRKLTDTRIAIAEFSLRFMELCDRMNFELPECYTDFMTQLERINDRHPV